MNLLRRFVDVQHRVCNEHRCYPSCQPIYLSTLDETELSDYKSRYEDVQHVRIKFFKQRWKAKQERITPDEFSELCRCLRTTVPWKYESRCQVTKV